MDVNKSVSSRNPWSWIPTLYFAQGVPFVVVNMVSVVLFKKMGISNTDIALYTSWLNLPWVIKPLWSPLVDIFKTKRYWIVGMQFFIGAALAGVAFSIPAASFFQWSLAILWLIAFSSATHDIAADGFYMLGLEQYQQAAFVGVRSTFFRVAMVTGQGAVVFIAGQLELSTGSVPTAWSFTFLGVAGLFLLLALYHRFILPYPAVDTSTVSDVRPMVVLKEFLNTFVVFFRKKEIVYILLFLLVYRFAEAQLLKLATPFMLDATEKGGLGLTTSAIGIVYGTVGIIALTVGGLAGGYAISKKGLKYWLWPMALSINVPDAVYVYLSFVQPENIYIINLMVVIEQLGYGFGFTAYMMFMVMVSEGAHKTAHYALCTGFMALGIMLPGMFSGWLQELLGYQSFFVWVMIATIPSFIVAGLVKVDPEFGKKKE
jgi:PAT family beta-lactamase induction signal transducer AmpG